MEDEEDIQDYLKAQLASDFKIRTYPNGKVALNEILKNKPDLIISDVMMPEMDGTTLCTKLKTNINTNDVPIILLTAKSREEDQLEGLQTGADAYILKPFNMDILRRTIINLLTMRRTYAQTQSYLTPPFKESELRQTYKQLSDAIQPYGEGRRPQQCADREETNA